MHDRLNNEYFEWLFNLACGERYSPNISYRKLLMYLHSVEFTYMFPKDSNRAADGVELRYYFALDNGYSDAPECLNDPCSVLEMMLALSMKGESIVDDPSIGDRTRQWFWGMISSLGLDNMIDNLFDKGSAQEIIKRFLNREYEPDGRGGLFTIRDSTYDLRTVEIWCQMCWYLDKFA